MGFSLSPVVVNMLTETFESEQDLCRGVRKSQSEGLAIYLLKAKCWFRYVDDTFAILRLPHGRKFHIWKYNLLKNFL